MINFFKFHNNPELLNKHHIAKYIDEIIEYEYNGEHEIIMQIIKKSPWHASHYAIKHLKCRWFEAEKYIMKEPYCAYNYAENVIKGRWTEAEPYIIKEYKAMVYYAQYIIKGRWLEAEEIIKKTGSNWDWKWYCNCLDIND